MTTIALWLLGWFGGICGLRCAAVFAEHLKAKRKQRAAREQLLDLLNARVSKGPYR